MNPYFPVSIIHDVERLDEAVEFLEKGLEFATQSRDSDEARLDNGAIAIRLTRGSGSRLRIDIHTRDLDAAARRLSEVGARPIDEARWISAQCQQQRFDAPHGFDLLLSRLYNEDEVGIVPDLPTSLEWSPDAIEQVKVLLRRVPVDFRDQARRRATERAEYLALERGDVSVDLELGIRAIIQMTPAFRVDEVRGTLSELGYDTSRWEKDFER